MYPEGYAAHPIGVQQLAAEKKLQFGAFFILFEPAGSLLQTTFVRRASSFKKEVVMKSR